jgi:hypothetical protein
MPKVKVLATSCVVRAHLSWTVPLRCPNMWKSQKDKRVLLPLNPFCKGANAID